MSGAPKSVACWCGDEIREPSAREAETFMRFHEVTCPAPELLAGDA